MAVWWNETINGAVESVLMQGECIKCDVPVRGVAGQLGKENRKARSSREKEGTFVLLDVSPGRGYKEWYSK